MVTVPAPWSRPARIPIVTEGARFITHCEFYPAFPVDLSMTIKPGDHTPAKVVYSNSKFTITITDETTGKTFTKTSVVSGAKRSSAEWIAEAPSSSSGVLPLANFTEVLFGDDHTSVANTCNAKDSSTNGPIGSFPASAIQEITMEKSGVKEAIPAKLSSDGSSFSVTWHAK